MKVICLHNYVSIFGGGTTKDKIYDVIEESVRGGMPVYYIKKDNGNKDWVVQSYFVTVEEDRNNKLNDLGI